MDKEGEKSSEGDTYRFLPSEKAELCFLHGTALIWNRKGYRVCDCVDGQTVVAHRKRRSLTPSHHTR
jgi:hypothetical protein